MCLYNVTRFCKWSIFYMGIFLVYMNDLAEGISLTAKLFADDTSIFSVVNDINVSANQINKDL